MVKPARQPDRVGDHMVSRAESDWRLKYPYRYTCSPLCSMVILTAGRRKICLMLQQNGHRCTCHPGRQNESRTACQRT
jgi:hypothetical protein